MYTDVSRNCQWPAPRLSIPHIPLVLLSRSHLVSAITHWSPCEIYSLLPLSVTRPSRAFIKIRKISGDNSLPCTTPVSKVIIVHCWLLDYILTVEYSYRDSSRSMSGMPYAHMTFHSAAFDMTLKTLVKSTSTRYTSFPWVNVSRVTHSNLVRFMSVPLPCLPPDWPGSRMPAHSTMTLNCALRMYISSWLVQLSRTTGWQSCGLSSVPPPLWSDPLSEDLEFCIWHGLHTLVWVTILDHQEKTRVVIIPYGVITQFPKNERLFTPKIACSHHQNLITLSKFLFTLSKICSHS